MFAGPSSANHVTAVSPQRRLTDNGDDAFASLYGCGAASGRCSSRPGSEWVTLSKTLLLQLVERICQLSFQTEVVVANAAARQEPSYLHVIEAETDRRQSADVIVNSMELGDNSAAETNGEGDRDTRTPTASGGATPSDVGAPSLAVQEAITDANTVGESCDNRMDDVERKCSSPVDVSVQRLSPPAAVSLSATDNTSSLAASIEANLPCRAVASVDDGASAAPHAADNRTVAAVETPNSCSFLKSPKTIDHFRFSADDVADSEKTTTASSGEQDQNVNTDNAKWATPSPITSPTKCLTVGKPGCPARRDYRRHTDEALRYGELVNRRRVLRAHRRHSGAGDVRSQPLADVSRDVIANCRTAGDDAGRVTSIYLHASRAHGRRIRTVQQPWMALNKSVVYRMLDVVLSQSAPSLPCGSGGNDVASAAAVPHSIKRPAKNRIWNPAISSAPSSPEYTTSGGGRDAYFSDELSRDHAAAGVSPPMASPTTFDAANAVFGQTGSRQSDSSNRPAELRVTTSPMQSDDTSPSILRDLLDGADPLPVSARRRSETAVHDASMASPSAFVGFGLAFSSAGSLHVSPMAAAAAAAYQRRRHHSAGRDDFVPDGWLSCAPRVSNRLAAMSQGFHNSLMFVDTTRGRDLYNYLRSPDGHPIVASASLSASSSCLESTATALDYTVQTLGRERRQVSAAAAAAAAVATAEPDRRSKASLPESGRARPGVTPRWVAFNKGDVSTLFESLATAMMAADATSSTSCSSSKMAAAAAAAAAAATPDDDDDVWRDSASPPDGASGSSNARHVRTRLVGSVDSVFRRPSAANEPVKWKSSLMRRMRDEVQAQKTERVTKRDSPPKDDSVTT